KLRPAASDGTPSGWRQGRWFLSSWYCCHDSDCSYWNSSRGWRSRLALFALEHGASALDFAYRRRRRFHPRCGYLVRWRLKQVERVVRRSELQLDPRVRHRLSSCGGRTQPPDAVAHVVSRHHGRAGFLEGDPRASWLLPLQSDVGSRRNHGRVFGPRPVSLLLRVVADAGPDVFSYRHMGPRATRLRGHEVFPVHAAERTADADRYSGALLHPPSGDRGLHVCIFRTTGHAVKPRH